MFSKRRMALMNGSEAAVSAELGSWGNQIKGVYVFWEEDKK